jgi:hypothetical protein
LAKVSIPHQERLRQLLNYDADTGELSWRERPLADFANQSLRAQKSWNTANAGKPALCLLNKAGYKRGTLEGCSVLSHRVIWKYVHGEEPDQIDHIDGNRQNNRLVNLRGVTAAINRKNAAMMRRNKSGQMGVFWTQRWPQYPGRWIATIGTKRLGSFETKEAAIAARKAAEIAHGYHENHGRPSAALPQS